jgi:hypothetical protein
MSAYNSPDQSRKPDSYLLSDPILKKFADDEDLNDLIINSQPSPERSTITTDREEDEDSRRNTRERWAGGESLSATKLGVMLNHMQVKLSSIYLLF